MFRRLALDLLRFAGGAALLAGTLCLWSAATRADDAAHDSSRVADAPAAAAAALVTAGTGPLRYELRAVLDAKEHSVAGTGVIAWTNASDKPQQELWLHLYLNAFKSERTLFMRSPAGGGFRGGALPERWGSIAVTRLYARELGRDLWPDADRHSPGEPDDETDIRVPLPREVAPGGSLTLEVAFDARLPSIVLRTGFSGSFNMVAQWFPKLARLEPDGRWSHFPFYRLSEFYADFSDYEVAIDVPEGFVVGATGVPEGPAERKDGRVRQRFSAPAVIDFAFAAAEGLQRAERQAGPVELVSLFPRGENEQAAVELDTAARDLSYYGERYGRYPYPRLTIVRPPHGAGEAGGMEYPMLITTGAGDCWRRLGVHSIEFLTAHELGHQWFYGLLASDEYRHALLDEGLATFAEVDAMEQRWPGRSAADALGFRIAAPSALRAFAAAVEHHGAIDRPASDFATGGDYAGLVYARTATALITIGRVFGQDRLWSALGRYAREQRFQHPRPAALVDAVRAEMGPEAAAALAGAFSGGWVDYQIARLSDRFVVVRREGDLTFPVEVELRDARGKSKRVLWDGRGDHAVLSWPEGGEISAALIDPDGRVLLDGDLSNNAARRDEQRLAPRVLAAGSWLAEAAMELAWP